MHTSIEVLAVVLAATSLLPAAGALDSHAPAMQGTLIVLNKAEATASLIDLASGASVATLPTGDGPHEVAVSPDGAMAVVCNYGARIPGNSLTIIDLKKQRVENVIDLGDYHRPHGIEFIDNGERIAVTCEQEQNVLVVNVASGALEKVIGTDARISHMLALSKHKNRAYVANIGSGSMTVVDLVEGVHISNVETGAGAEGIAVSPNGREVWVANRDANTITIIDADSLDVLDSVECPSFPIRVKFTPDGTRVLVSNARSGDVAIFDAERRESIKRIPMELTAVEQTDERLFGDQFGQSPVPVGILILPTGSQAFVANTNADIITVIDLEKLEVSGRLIAGKEPDGLGFTPLVMTAGD